MENEFERIKRLPPYVFAEVNQLKAELRSKGRDIIDFGMGNPDMPTPEHIRQNLKKLLINQEREGIQVLEEFLVLERLNQNIIKGGLMLIWTLKMK